MKMPIHQPQASRNREGRALRGALAGVTPQGCNVLEWAVCAGAVAGCTALTGPALVACVAAAAPGCVKCVT